jgi:uncharacterized protein involved in outer membrane biogenesis
MVKFIARWTFRLLILLVVLAIGLLLLKDTLIKAVLEHRLRKETGLEATIDKVEMRLGAPTITIEGLKIHNSAEFGGSIFVDLPELHAEYDRPSLRHHKLRLKLLRLNLAELSLVRSQTGKTNFMELGSHVENNINTGQSVGVPLEFDGVETLNASFGKLRLTDLKVPENSREIDVNLKNEIASEVRTQEDLMALAIRVVLRNGLSLIANPAAARQSVKPTVSEGEPVAPEAPTGK